MEAKQFLKQAKNARIKIKNKLIEVQQWEDVKTSITACMDTERVQASSPKDKLSIAVAECEAAEDEVLEKVKNYRATMEMVTQTIEQLDSATEYNVLHMRYIQFKDLQEIADHYGKEYGWVTTTHGRALRNVQAILDGKDTI